MKINLSMFPEDNHYATETHLLKEGVESTHNLAALFQQFAVAIGFSYVAGVSFYDKKGVEVGHSNLL